MSESKMKYDSIKVDKERFIPIPKAQLVDILLAKLSTSEEKSQFTELCCAIESLFHVQRISQIEEIKKCYSPFDRRNKCKDLNLDRNELKERQNTLLKNIFNTLDDANFTPITYDNYKNALESVFLSDLPIVVDWPKLDSSMLNDFYNEYPNYNPYLTQKCKNNNSNDKNCNTNNNNNEKNSSNSEEVRPPPFWQHFLLFHRGFGTHIESSLFFSHKINIISQDVFAITKSLMIELFDYATAKLFEQLINNNSKNSNNGNNGGNGNENNDEVSTTLESEASLMPQMSIEDKLSTFSAENEENKNESETTDSTDSTELNSVKFERLSLVDTYKIVRKEGLGSIIWWFLSAVKLTEPTFNSLVLIYRELPEGKIDEKLRRAKERSKKYKEKLIKTVKNATKATKSLKNFESTIEKAVKNASDKSPATPATADASDTNDVNIDNKEEEVDKNNNMKNTERIVDETGRSHGRSCMEEPSVENSIVKANQSVLDEAIRIQYFGQVPMADLEVIFPCKRLSLRLMEQIYLFVILFMGIYVIFKEMFFDDNSNNGEKENIAKVWITEMVVIGIIILMVRAVQWYRLTQRNYEFSLNNILYKSSMATDRNVLISLLDDVEEQEFMETILAYFVLLKHKNEAIDSTKKVDVLCESLIKEEIGKNCGVDVEICDAMRKLKVLGLLKMDTFGDIIEVKELTNAIETIKTHWNAFSQEWQHGWNPLFIRTRESSPDSNVASF